MKKKTVTYLMILCVFKFEEYEIREWWSKKRRKKWVKARKKSG